MGQSIPKLVETANLDALNLERGGYIGRFL